jgi:TetR/AcrR family fatty acid metabolism transcriptional regulator
MSSEIETIDQKRPSFIEQARRTQIVECAIEAIADLGFAQASLAQIAKRAGISTGVISYYFAGKDDLIREVSAHVFTTGEAFIWPRVQAETTAPGALKAFIKGSIDFVAGHPKYSLAFMNIFRAGRGESDGPRYDPAIQQPRRTGFYEILEWGQRDGAFRPFSLKVMVESIIEAVDAVPPLLVAEPDLDLRAYAEELAELFDRATRADPPKPPERESPAP